MGKKKKQTTEATVTTETVTLENITSATVTEKKKPGRPVIQNSVRQLKLEAQAKRVAENGGMLRRGRPVLPTSSRQQKLQDKLNKMAAGVIIKRGRPKMIKVEETAMVG